MFSNMKLNSLVILMFAVTNAFVINYNSISSNFNGVYGYHRNIGIKLAEKIKKQESEISMQRITGGLVTEIEAVPYQAGLIISVLNNLSICGGSIISATKVLTAAHCYADGSSTAEAILVVLGSNQLFFGGTRVDAVDVVAHSGFNPVTAENDIAVIRVPSVVCSCKRFLKIFILSTFLRKVSKICLVINGILKFALTRILKFPAQIQPVALPSGEVNMDFTGYQALASGYGMTSDAEDVELLQTVSSVTVPVISNAECAAVYGGFILSQHICTGGVGGRGTCGGDSGGPLVVNLDSRIVLVGITSFGAELCTLSYPSAYVRVTEFLDWISAQMD
ncbi:brachyurin-like [Cydia pomonella]|uniref:brachyurin-like n=1 Tax=Cydia pomonella TaxID=82600 RepID=UPI002ADE21D2|nr:brachyurin-like [Cydia pomonella]